MYDPRKDFSIAQTHSMIELNQTKANELRLAYEDLTGPNAIFKVEATGIGINYEWFIRLAKDIGDDNKWIPIKDSNCSEFQLGWLEGTPEYYDGCQVICKVSNTAGSVYSNYATLTITKPTSAPEITEQPKSQSVNVGSYDAYNKRRFAKYVIPVNGGSTGGGLSEAEVNAKIETNNKTIVETIDNKITTNNETVIAPTYQTKETSLSAAYFGGNEGSKITVEAALDYLQKNIGTGGTGEAGTTDYNDLTNKPKINGVELIGDKSIEDLGIINVVNTYLQNKDIVVPEYQQTTGTGEDGQISAGVENQLHFNEDNTDDDTEITLSDNYITKISLEVLANTKDGSRVTDTMAEFIALKVNGVLTVSAVDIDCAHSIGEEIQLNLDAKEIDGKLTVSVKPTIDCIVHSYLKKIEVSKITTNTSETI